MLSLIMAYRSFGRFRQAFTRLDTPPLSIRHHPGSVIARRQGSVAHDQLAVKGLVQLEDGIVSVSESPGGASLPQEVLDLLDQRLDRGIQLFVLRPVAAREHEAQAV